MSINIDTIAANSLASFTRRLKVPAEFTNPEERVLHVAHKLSHLKGSRSTTLSRLEEQAEKIPQAIQERQQFYYQLTDPTPINQTIPDIFRALASREVLVNRGESGEVTESWLNFSDADKEIADSIVQKVISGESTQAPDLNNALDTVHAELTLNSRIERLIFIRLAIQLASMKAEIGNDSIDPLEHIRHDLYSPTSERSLVKSEVDARRILRYLYEAKDSNDYTKDFYAEAVQRIEEIRNHHGRIALGENGVVKKPMRKLSHLSIPSQENTGTTQHNNSNNLILKDGRLHTSQESPARIRNKTLKDLLDTEENYLKWGVGRIFNSDHSMIVLAALDGKLPEDYL